MSDRLTGRVVIVTGGARGLGRAYADRLTAAGATVCVVDVERGAPYEADVTSADAVDAVVAAVLDRHGRIDGLVNNAGGAMLPSAPFDSFSRAEWSRVVDVNLTGQWVCAAAVAPAMRAAGYGKIVNVSSTVVAKGGPVGLSPYIAAKAGVVGLTRALARELGPAGIRVNAIAPGYIPVDTPKAVHSPAAAAALEERVAAEQCLPLVGKPSDLAPVVEFLCSADSDFVTGQVLNVDGGWVHG
ncbi:MAG: SDR family oxidoreductase [Actinophytocola sp.]|uniref:SDR family NAD(P)-dependent oxidoreductase n=1 Tax=Actinophytocola sp. TaxID=1872138 RepID=UPI003C79018D